MGNIAETHINIRPETWEKIHAIDDKVKKLQEQKRAIVAEELKDVCEAYDIDVKSRLEAAHWVGMDPVEAINFAVAKKIKLRNREAERDKNGI